MNVALQHIARIIEANKYNEAINYCNDLLTKSNHPQIHLFLAIAYGEKGDISKSTELFENLSSYFPENNDVFYNFGLILQKNGKFKKALKKYKTCIRLNPDNFSAWNNMGEIYRKNKSFDSAISSFSNCVRLKPNNSQYVRNFGIALYQNKQFVKAQPLLVKAISKGHIDIDCCFATLDTLLSLRQLKLATKISLLAIENHGEDSEILNLAGINELEKRKFNTAINFFKKSVANKPKFLNAMCNLATTYLFAGKANECIDMINKILEIGIEESFVFAALMHEKSNNTDLANKSVNKGLDLFPTNPELLLLKAKLLKKEKKYSESLETINFALNNCHNKELKCSAYYEKGQLLDSSSQFGLAWKQIKKANSLSQKTWKKINSNPDTFELSCQSIINSLALVQEPNNVNLTTLQGENLIFILGFPRSGTTLLDSILSAHDDITVLEEAPVIGETYDLIKSISPKTYGERIAMLSENEILTLRKFYYSALSDYCDWDGNGVLVDKSPLNTMHVGLLSTLFPKSKIIFSKRHPLDVSLSCLFQDFKMNSFMTNLTSIERTAKTYNSMLSVWKASVEKLEIKFRYQSYEKLVSDFENQTKELFKYLELPWQNKVLNYQKELKKRGAISTPSYNQVNQPIYQSAKNRYKNYLPYLDEAIEILEPWIKYFNYKV